MIVQINNLTKADRLKAKLGIFNIILQYGEYEIYIKRGSISALFNFKFYPRLKYKQKLIAKIGQFCEFSNTSILLGGEHEKKKIHNVFGGSLELLLADKDGEFIPTSKGLIDIDNCCVFGYGSIILSGVKVGMSSQVAASALLNTTYNENSLIAGVPGKVISTRISEVDYLDIKKTKWWDASYEYIAASMSDLQNGRRLRYNYQPNKYSTFSLIYRLDLIDSAINKMSLNGFEYDNARYGTDNIGSTFINYLNSFDGTGPVQINTNAADLILEN